MRQHIVCHKQPVSRGKGLWGQCLAAHCCASRSEPLTPQWGPHCPPHRLVEIRLVHVKPLGIMPDTRLSERPTLAAVAAIAHAERGAFSATRRQSAREGASRPAAWAAEHRAPGADFRGEGGWKVQAHPGVPAGRGRCRLAGCLPSETTALAGCLSPPRPHQPPEEHGALRLSSLLRSAFLFTVHHGRGDSLRNVKGLVIKEMKTFA